MSSWSKEWAATAAETPTRYLFITINVFIKKVMYIHHQVQIVHQYVTNSEIGNQDHTIITVEEKGQTYTEKKKKKKKRNSITGLLLFIQMSWIMIQSNPTKVPLFAVNFVRKPKLQDSSFSGNKIILIPTNKINFEKQTLNNSCIAWLPRNSLKMKQQFFMSLIHSLMESLVSSKHARILISFNFNTCQKKQFLLSIVSSETHFALFFFFQKQKKQKEEQKPVFHEQNNTSI